MEFEPSGFARVTTLSAADFSGNITIRAVACTMFFPFCWRSACTLVADDAVLWRYMDFARFIQTIESQTTNDLIFPFGLELFYPFHPSGTPCPSLTMVLTQ